jgi:hypothetical protein
VACISFRVDRRNVPHFEVTTPFLAAIVKGTKFEVSVHDDHADVNVSEGKVEVRSAISRAATSGQARHHRPSIAGCARRYQGARPQRTGPGM